MASAGYGDDYVMAIDILRMIRSSGGLAVAVVVKPFSFEGQRRQDEVGHRTCFQYKCILFIIEILILKFFFESKCHLCCLNI